MMEVTNTELNNHSDIKDQLIDIEKYYGTCCCCLESISRKDIWSEYNWMGCPEIYSDMLFECFGLSVTEERNNRIHICEICITTLRSCLYFRRQVVKCHSEMMNQIPNAANNLKEESCSEQTLVNCVEDKGSNEKTTTPTEITTGDRENSCENDVKRVTRRKKNGKRKSNYMKTRQNICLILEHSTLVPFRSKKGYFNCFYCNKQHAVFEELKSHMIEKHKDIDFRRIMNSILRPATVKADCSDIVCKICTSRLKNMDELIQHLIDVHKIAFNYEDKLKPKDCILPYNLSDGRNRCSVCDKEFHFFKTLSKHMNEHSSNYVCDECGKCFLLPERLRAHKQMHADNSAVECNQCGKICPSNIILRSHIRYTHNKAVYICSICNESYKSFKERLKHMEIVHGRKLNLICEFCSRSFATPCSLSVHVKNEHLNKASESKFPCEICPMAFKSRSALKSHSIVHSGERNFECDVCHKKYGRLKTLGEHMKIHMNDRRWSCGDCGQTFVQKCSLRNHIRVHHNGRDKDLLILYRGKPIVKE